MPSSGLTIGKLRCEYRANPLGIDVERPRLSWQVASTERGQRQTRYRFVAASRRDRLERGKADLWDSGLVTSARTVHIPYEGVELQSRQRVWWRVEVWDRHDRPTISDPAWWEIGLLAPSDWRAVWIGATVQPAVVPRASASARPRPKPELAALDLPPCPLLRRDFACSRPVRQARLYLTARGLYEASLNGQRIGDARLAPGWTDYRRRIQYQTYDVTDFVRKGSNTLGAILATGWYAGHIGWSLQTKHYGSVPQLLAQLEIDHGDDQPTIVASDDGWTTATGPLRYADLIMGESFDARLVEPGWDQPGFDDRHWAPVATGERDGVALVADRAEPVRVTQELPPATIERRDERTNVIDFGQNFAGWVRLRASGAAGTTIRLRFGEMLDIDGSLYTDNLRSAHQTDVWTLGGDGDETWEPRFTFHGFRFVEVTDYPGDLSADAIVGRVVESATEPAGTFACSDPLVNQLQQNIVWSQRGNFLSIPTDCPQRDERLGWLADAQVFARTASYNRNVAAFMTKWLIDIADAQSPEGAFPDVAPRLIDQADGAPAWGNAGVILPWTLYLHYGDTRLIDEHFAAMTRWLDYVERANPDYCWRNARGNDFGDWLALDGDDPADPFRSRTPKVLLATAFWANDARLMARMAAATGRENEAARFQSLFEHIKAAFNSAFVGPDGMVTGDTQTGYLLALAFELLPERIRPAAARRLVEAIERRDWHLTTGFIGVGLLCPVLTAVGYPEVAYRLLRNDTYPSWGYSIRHGATTIWERWNGWTETDGFADPGMNSFNHYALGSVGEWFYHGIVGINVDPDRPGFEHITIHPHPGGGLTWARAEVQTMRGPVRSGWSIDGGVLSVEITIPANTTATAAIPCPPGADLLEGGRPVTRATCVSVLRRDAERVYAALEAGDYRFQAPFSGPVTALD